MKAITVLVGAACALIASAAIAQERLPVHDAKQLMLSALVISLSPMELTADSAGMVLMILMLAIRGLIRLAIYIVIGALILQAVLSWINPYSPVAPLVAILLLQVVLMFV